MPFIPNDRSRLLTGRNVALSLVIGALFVLANVSRVSAQTSGRRLTIAVLDFGETAFAREAVEKFLRNLKLENSVEIFDRDQARAAARGSDYAGSLNLSLNEARNLGAVLGSDFFVLGDAQTLRRSPSAGPVYFESYASVFLVSARTGRLIAWERPSFEGSNPVDSEKLLLNEISSPETRHRYLVMLRRAQADERSQRQIAVERNTPVIEEAPGEASEQSGLRLPRPYRRLRPAYPDTAARADAEGTVDVLVDLDTEGEVNRVGLARWAGFGLDQAAL